MKSERPAARRDAMRLVVLTARRLHAQCLDNSHCEGLCERREALRVLLLTLSEALLGKMPAVSVLSLPGEAQKTALLLALLAVTRTQCALDTVRCTPLLSNKDSPAQSERLSTAVAEAAVAVLPVLRAVLLREKDVTCASLIGTVVAQIVLLTSHCLNHTNSNDNNNNNSSSGDSSNSEDSVSAAVSVFWADVKVDFDKTISASTAAAAPSPLRQAVFVALAELVSAVSLRTDDSSSNRVYELVCRSLSSQFASSAQGFLRDAVVARKQPWSVEASLALCFLCEAALVDSDLRDALRASKLLSVALFSASSTALSSTMFGDSARGLLDGSLPVCDYLVALDDATRKNGEEEGEEEEVCFSPRVLQQSVETRATALCSLRVLSCAARLDCEAWAKLLRRGGGRSSIETKGASDEKEGIVSIAAQRLVDAALTAHRVGLAAFAAQSLRIACATETETVTETESAHSRNAAAVEAVVWSLWKTVQALSDKAEAAAADRRQQHNSALADDHQQQSTTATGHAATPPALRSSSVKKLLALLVQCLPASFSSISSSSTSSSSSLTLALGVSLVASHPLVSPSAASAAHWLRRHALPALAIRCHRNTANTAETDDEEEEALCARLVDALSLAAQQSSSSQVAAHRAVAVLVDALLPPADFARHVVQSSPSLARRFLRSHVAALVARVPLRRENAVFALSDEDRLVAAHPEAVVERELQALRIKIEAESGEITNADRKRAGPRSSRKGHFGSEVVEDEAWTEKVRREKAAKLMQSTEAVAVDTLAATVFARKAVIDAAVRDVRSGFDAIRALCWLPQNQARLAFTELLFASPALFDFLTVELVADHVRQCLQETLRHVVEPALSDSCR
jgi:hypothetical protein